MGRLNKLEFLMGRPFHRLHLRDPGLCWYLHGIPGLGADLPQTLAALRRLIAPLEAGKLLMLGQSMGGYGAILYGHALGADKAVAFGPLSHMDPEESRRNGDTRWLPVMERLAADGLAAADTDLLALLAERPSRMTLRLHYGMRPDDPAHGATNLDLLHADRFASLPGCRITRHPDSDHVVVEHLKRRRELDAVLLEELFDIDCALLHRRQRPLLDDRMLQWMAENMLRGADRQKLLTHLQETGFAALTARSAMAEVERDPVYLAAAKLLEQRNGS